MSTVSTIQGANAIKRWMKRQEDKGFSPTANEIWNRIKRSYPNLHEKELEDMFQKCSTK